jgi:hypothetical protein
MRLDFNVLWVDDQPERVAAQITSITLKMASEGFEFKPRLCTTIADVESAIDEDVFTDEVDLILVDWDLGNDMHGEDAIERIRQIVQYKDVVFYSGQASVVELRKKAYERQLEGVYCASRADLIDEVVGVFESLIKKVLDLDHTRGIVMGATSDIDDMVNRCLTLAHGKLDDTGKAKFIEEALNRVTDQVQKLVKLGDKLKASPSVEALFKAHMLFTSDHRLRLLASVLGMDEFAAYSAGVEKVESYRKGVVHDADNVVDIAQMRELRKLILSLRADFRALLDAMQA